jgi:CHAT domain-containing protein
MRALVSDTRETEFMLKTRRSPTSSALLLFSICIASVLLFHVRESTARNESDVQQALAQGDVYFNKSQYPAASKRYEDAAALAEKNGDTVAEARALSRLARVSTYLGKKQVARQHLTKAFGLLRQSGDTPEAKNVSGEALTVDGELLQDTGKFQKALTQLNEALKSLDGDRDGQARAHLFLGYINGSIGNTDKALTEIEQAQKLYQDVNNKVGEAQTLSALGLFYLDRKEPNRSIDLHSSAIKIFHAIGDLHSEGIANNATGQAYEALNEPKLALASYERALRLFENAGAMNGIAPTTCLVAHGHFINNHVDEALTFYKRCLNLTRAAGMGRTEAGALYEIASVYASQQRYKMAFSQQRKAQKFYAHIGDKRGLARALNVYGNLWIQAGQKQRALDAYQQALNLSAETGEQDTQLQALYGLAQTNLANGAPEAALLFIQRSLKLIEALRANVASPEFRTSYFSGEGQHYDLAIEILTELAKRHPEKDFGAQALLVSEQSRARLLVDLVNESRAKNRRHISNELTEREIELRGLIRAHAEYRMRLGSNPKDPAEVTETDAELAQLRAQYQQVEAQLRQQNPYLSSLEQFAPLNLEQIQKELPNDTMLLEYSLGDERSYLFAVTSDSFQIYELPKRQILEDTERNCYELLTARQRFADADDYPAKVAAADKAFSDIAPTLTQMLLGPVADKLGNKRLIVVPEGALQYVPFTALPSPVAPESVLLETNEIVIEPSFSALVAIRKNIPKHPISPDKLVAVIADPVSSNSDARVPSAPAGAVVADDRGPLTRDDSLRRLVHASEEADAISAAAPKGTTMVAKGFDANRETAMSANIGQYQIVHFATHGILDSEHPELSGILLSTVDRNGAKTEGLMSLHDIYSLDLSAELTVLSACETALGKNIKGEGLIGLSHAFMSAGSKSVVSSLWKVDDRATAALMREFYESMLQQGKSPAAALRAAQLNMRRDKRTKAPYYWAGFVIQGEYTNRINVGSHSRFRVALVLLFLLSLITAGVLVFYRRKHRLLRTHSNGAEYNA